MGGDGGGAYGCVRVCMLNSGYNNGVMIMIIIKCRDLRIMKIMIMMIWESVINMSVKMVG